MNYSNPYTSLEECSTDSTKRDGSYENHLQDVFFSYLEEWIRDNFDPSEHPEEVVEYLNHMNRTGGKKTELHFIIQDVLVRKQGEKRTCLNYCGVNRIPSTWRKEQVQRG